MTTGIYCIRNTQNGKLYVGESKNIHKRWIFHKWKLNKGIHYIKEMQAEWTANKAVFSFEIIEECPADELYEKEKYWINKLNSINKGYNSAVGGSGIVLPVRTPEHNRHISEALKGRVSPMKDKKFTAEHKMKISKALKGNTNAGFGKDNHASKPVRSITTGIEYECANQAGILCGSKAKDTPGANITACCNKRRQFAFGQKWEYIL
jgi:group I intron endonuclease